MKALIAMSGGVDSSVAASLISEQGIECVGCTMMLHDMGEVIPEGEKACGSTRDIEDAKRVCEKLNMEHHVFDLRKEFSDSIMKYFVDSYEKGRTPNPCIECNKKFKFNELVGKAREFGCEYVVSGHYAIIEETPDGFILRKGADPSKDQSYVLYNMTQEVLAHTLMPLGTMSKDHIRQLAAERGFTNAKKKDSQDICFIPDGDYAKFIDEYRGYSDEPGDFVDMEGNVLGQHQGIIHYTIGQRKGLGQGFGKRIYVCEIDAENNRVVLGDNEDLFKTDLRVEEVNWISGKTPDGPIRCKARVRYNQQEKWATVTPDGDDAVTISFDEPQRAVTPGQSAVLYDGDIILGGGIIV